MLLIAVIAALAFGGYRALTDGRFRGTHRVRDAESSPAPAQPDAHPVDSPAVTKISVLADTPWSADLGDKATLLQFSSAFCAPCRATRRILTEVAEVVPGVTHLEIDAEQHLELVRRVGVLRTPTTLILDADGTEVTRAAGAPRKEQVLNALAQLGDR